MATLRRPLEVIQGTEYRERYTAFFDEAKTDPADVTDFDAQLLVRRRQFRGSPEITRASTLDGRISNGGTDGFFEVNISGGDTMDWPEGDFYYWFNVWPIGNNGAGSCWLRGPFKILPGVEVV